MGKPKMKFFRYRRPSLKTLLGITKAKKRIKKELGITEFMKPFRWWTNTKREVQAEDRLRIPDRAADSGWIAQAGRLLGGGRGRRSGVECGGGRDGELDEGE